MARQCSTPGCILQQFHLGLCDTRGTRSLCKTSDSAGKLEASRRDRFGVSGGIKKNRKGAGKMDPPKFDAGDRVEVYFNDRFWYPGTVVRWVRIPTQRTYKYEVCFDSGLQLPFERYPLERGVIAEGAERPQIPDAVAPPPEPKTARLPPALPSGLASTPFRRIRFGDRVCVAWTATAHYYGVVRDTATRLERKKTQRGVQVSYDDGTKTWHWEHDPDGMEVALIPTGPQAGNSAMVVYDSPGMDVAEDESDEGEGAAAAPAPASAPAPAPAPAPARPPIYTVGGGSMCAETLIDILHTMDNVPYLGKILQKYLTGAIDKGGFIVEVKEVVGGEKLRAALGEKQPPPRPTAPAPPAPPPEAPMDTSKQEVTTVARIVDVAGTACED